MSQIRQQSTEDLKSAGRLLAYFGYDVNTAIEAIRMAHEIGSEAYAAGQAAMKKELQSVSASTQPGAVSGVPSQPAAVAGAVVQNAAVRPPGT